MIGSNGPRMLSIAAEHSQVWNTWWLDYGNTAEGFAELAARRSRRTSSAARACSSSSTASRTSGGRRCRQSPKRGSPTRSENWARPAPTR